jgi:hypothetical protein
VPPIKPLLRGATVSRTCDSAFTNRGQIALSISGHLSTAAELLEEIGQEVFELVAAINRVAEIS